MKDLETSKTLNILSLACLIAYVIFNCKWLVIISLILLFFNIIGGKGPSFIAKLWLGFASFIGNINAKIILAIMFYLVLTPLSMVYRIFNKEAVNYFKTRHDSTYYRDVNITYKKENFEKLW
jgi:hypothetical protein